MTSSLVGSEMCIRDSCVGATNPALFESHAGCGKESCALGYDCLISCAVSYTHLTLPTICSV
eukprot:5722389-Prorocentrum_lima.AAC.1